MDLTGEGGEGTALLTPFVGCRRKKSKRLKSLGERLRTGSAGLSVRFEAVKPHAYHISHLPLTEVPLKALHEKLSASL
uniref:Uncharacterized protein n=1 Tax=Fundulus heteroclitus TaxID=8078 RepID=A0A3Q2QBB1_FUNHE